MYTPEQLELFRKAGNIAAMARAFGAKLIKEGADVIEVLEKVDEFILKKGGKPAFPAQMAFDEVAAHHAPRRADKITVKDGNLINLDLGVEMDGYVADNAVCIDVGNNHKELCNASRDALRAAIKLMGPGVKCREIGKEIEEIITGAGFKPIRNLAGHAVGRYIIHAPPSIPNYDNRDETELKPGMVLACEPFATDGFGLIHETGIPGIYMLREKKPVRGQITREVLKEIEKYNGLPFALRNLDRVLPPAKINYAIRELMNIEALKSFGPLVEKGKGLVSQWENTMIITEDGCEVTTKCDDDVF